MIKSICIVRLSALGDVLMMVPLIRTLQAHFPNAHLTWIISRPAYDLVKDLDGVEFMVISKPKSLSDYFAFYKQMRDKQFDVLLAPQASLRANLLYPLIRAKRKIGYDKNRANDLHRCFVHESIEAAQEHTLDGFLGFAKAIGAEKKVIRWDIPISEEDESWASSALSSSEERPLFLVNPAASKPERSWSIANYIEVIKHMQQQWQAHVILTGGPTDHDKQLGDAIAKEVQVVNLIGKTKPKQLLATIRRGHLMLCPDTGPSHMANAVGTPVIALHAVTNPEISGPYLYRHLVVNKYPEALASLGKQAEWGTQVHGPETMHHISVKEVITHLNQVVPSIVGK